MNKKNQMLTTYELSFTLVGCIVGAGILSLPNTVVGIAKQDGWVSIIIGGVYPLYIVLIGGIIIKKYPNNNIMDLSKAYLGNILGNTLNLIFMLQFLLYAVAAMAGSCNTFRAYSIPFMTHFKVVLVFVLIVLYASTKGLKVLARFSVLVFYLLCIVLSASLISIKEGSLINLRPLFGVSTGKIIKGSIESAFSYGNMEFLLVIYPYVMDKKSILKTSLKTTFVIITMYTYIVTSAIYYAGPDLLPKQLWPFLLLAESVKIPVINNFRFVVIFIWIIIAFKTVSLQFYAATKVLNNITKINRKTVCILLLPFLFTFSFFMKNEVVRRDFLGGIMPKVTMFNILYVTLIALLTLIKSVSLKNSNVSID